MNRGYFSQLMSSNADKTELLWAGSRYAAAAVLDSSGLSLCLGDETVEPSDHVRVLGITFSSDLSLDKHISSVTVTCFYFLHQLWRVRRSLDIDSTKMLVHAFIMSRVDYCNAVLAGSPQYKLTHFNVCWMLQPVSSLALASLIRAYLVFCTMNCTGLMSLNECSTSWQWQFSDSEFIGIFKIKHRGTWSTAAFQSLMSASPADNICDLIVVKSWLYLVFDEAIHRTAAVV